MTLARFSDYDDAFAWLARHTNYETMATQSYDSRTYGLDRVSRLLDALGRPERGKRVVQIVGSKGKGSTAAMLASVLGAAGLRTGRYTSPHLVHPRERVVVDGRPVADAAFCAALAKVAPAVEDARARGEALTFFEILTAAALVAFDDAGCEAIVLEAGMGGRLDATTAAEAELVILTNVSLDHTKHLGDTLAAVAAEKAAAMRSGRPLVCGEPPDSSAGRVIAATARERDVPVTWLDEASTAHVASTGLSRDGAGGTVFDLQHELQHWRGLRTPLPGRHQAANAALAVLAARALVRADDAAVRAGLAATNFPARLSVHGTRPLVLVDGAHSPTSVAALAAFLRLHAPPGRRIVVFGIAADKDVDGCLRALLDTCDLLVATTSDQPRALPPEELAGRARDAGLAAVTAQDVRRAVDVARAEARPDDTIVVTGSLYLCGAFLALTSPGE